MARIDVSTGAVLPDDGAAGALAARVWLPAVQGPAVVAIRETEAIDVSAAFPTMRDLCETAAPAASLRAATGPGLGPLDAILANTPPDRRDPTRPYLLTPIDLQAVKAAGVTFPISMLERVIEERARGDLAAAAKLREEVNGLVGGDLATLRPGSPQAMALKDALVARGRLEPVSGSRHRSRRGDFHEVPAAFRRRMG